jgi:hypothetical protein
MSIKHTKIKLTNWIQNKKWIKKVARNADKESWRRPCSQLRVILELVAVTVESNTSREITLVLVIARKG